MHEQGREIPVVALTSTFCPVVLEICSFTFTAKVSLQSAFPGIALPGAPVTCHGDRYFAHHVQLL